MDVMLAARGVRRKTIAKKSGAAGGKHPNSDVFLGLVWHQAKPATERPPRWRGSVTIVRASSADDARWARIIDAAAEQLRLKALDAVAGSHPRVVVHLSAARTEAIIDCAVFW